ncbi:MAG: hypothetical protein QM665_09800 [Desulfovibrio sp.]
MRRLPAVATQEGTDASSVVTQASSVVTQETTLEDSTCNDTVSSLQSLSPSVSPAERLPRRYALGPHRKTVLTQPETKSPPC